MRSQRNQTVCIFLALKVSSNTLRLPLADTLELSRCSRSRYVRFNTERFENCGRSRQDFGRNQEPHQPADGTVAPGIYSANGVLAAALLVTEDAAGNQSTGVLVTASIVLAPSPNVAVLILHRTGIRGAALSQVSVKVAGLTLVPAYAGAAPGYPGEDQINVQLPYSLKGSGNTALTGNIAGQQSNTVHIQIQ